MAVTGNGNHIFHVTAPPRVTTSDYRYQVESLAAAEFRGRDDELAAMAEFCSAPGTVSSGADAYWRWLAPAWAGKTALMARFVLEPPAGVDIVSFFITSRLNRQNDRAAFCEVVHRQFYALLGEEEPAVTEYTREASLLAAMERAAAMCEGRGRRLVLVVDGLDEDRGVLAGPDSHSIAALLPGSPAHGMRVVVAGRPHPPIPDDVADAHPLRRSTISRWLLPSPFAAAVRREAEDSLVRMLDAGGLARELLGLVTAAGGGLTAADLAKLAGTRPRLVERELSTVTGRAFRVRSPHWSSLEDGVLAAGVYTLAHEEIQRSAIELLTDEELTTLRERLHKWADSFQVRRWPPGTPEYLLRGYSQLLRTQGDTERLVRLASDAHRHSRLWQRSGSDVDALAELSAAFDSLVVCGNCSPAEVGNAFLLAVRRDTLLSRSESLPDALIAVWAGLGHVRRAVSLARARQDELGRLRALMGVVQTLVTIGALPQAAEVAGEAAHIAGNAVGPRRGEAAACAVAMLAVAGAADRAVDMTCTLVPREARDQVLAQAADAALQAGQRSTAESLARAAASSMPDIVPAVTAQALAMDGNYLQAVAVVRTVGNDGLRARLLADVAAAMAKDGHLDAVAVAEEALSGGRADALAASAVALTYAGEHQRAAELCRSLFDPYAQMTSLACIATILAVSGEADSAVKLAHEAAGLAGQVIAGNLRTHGLTMAAQALALTIHHEQAVELLQPLKRPDEWEQAVADVVAGLAQAAGDLGPATRLARSLSVPRSRSRALSNVAAAHLYAGSREQAKDLAQEASDAARRSTSWGESHHVARLAAILAKSSAPVLAIEAARRISEPDMQAMALLEAAAGATASNGPPYGADIARAITDPRWRAQGLGWAAAAAARSGSLQLAGNLVQEMREAEGSLPPGQLLSADHTQAALAELASALTDAGQDDAADTVAATAQHSWLRAKVLTAMAGSLVARGEDEKALSLVREIAASPLASRHLASVAAIWVRADSAPRALEAIQFLPHVADQAEALALTAQSLAGTDGTSQGSVLAHHAHALADALTASNWPDHVLSEHVKLLLRQGHLNLAMAVSQHIEETQLRLQSIALSDVAVRPMTSSPPALDDQQDVEAEASFLVAQATDAHGHQQAVASVAAALAWTGQHDRARSLSHALPDGINKDEAVASIAEALAAFGYYTQGCELARSLPEALQRDQVLSSVACWAAQRGDFLTAVDLGAGSNLHEQHSFALLTTVRLAIKEQQYAEAAVAAHALTDTSEQVRALCAISAAASQQGDQDFVDELTSKLDALLSPASETEDWARRQRGSLKAAVAEGWGESPAGCAAAIEALSLAPWHVCLHAVHRTAPQAMQAALSAVLYEEEDAALASSVSNSTGHRHE
ncbi:hypothetical protein [Streptomyces roseolus]|uniref:hypothetical protein n=1 Tax=Streptomyces roseolus TaxID=67358 RepID=UPI001671C918|nr:hypothetical protein [Streptomyces roseolus]GGR64806.1 hypothetical protein GCM10010282_67280 [Streptomyces roseolus]